MQNLILTAVETLRSDITPEFSLPTEIYINRNLTDNIADIISKFGSRVIIITTSSDFNIYSEEIEQILISLKNSDIGCIVFDQLPSEPNTEDIDSAVSFTKKTNCDIILGFGGVESLNSAKAVSLLTSNYIFCYDLFKKPEIPNKPVKLLTMPAYPVYGQEITPLFFLDEIHNNTKKAYFNKILYPVAAIIDPVLSIKKEEEVITKSTVSTLAIATESVISTNNNDVINTFALKSIDLIFRNLPLVYKEAKNVNSRQFIAIASLLSGITFSIAYLSATLSISLALASKCDLTVESAMSIILPHIMEFNLTSSPGKYVQMSKVMGEDVKEITVIEAAIKAVEAIRKLELDTNIPQKLSNYEISKSMFQDIAKLAVSYPFHENAPRALNVNEIETILIAAY